MAHRPTEIKVKKARSSFTLLDVPIQGTEHIRRSQQGPSKFQRKIQRKHHRCVKSHHVKGIDILIDNNFA